jgi:hypothetical protein
MASTPAVGPSPTTRTNTSGHAAQHDQQEPQGLAHGEGQGGHAPAQRRHRQHARGHQRQGQRDEQRERHACGGNRHGAPGFAHHQGQKVDRHRRRQKAAQKLAGDFAAFRVEELPGLELGGGEQWPQQRQGRTGPEHAAQPGGVA